MDTRLYSPRGPLKSSQEDSNLFDPGKALALVDGDEGLFRELSGLFAQQCPGQLLAVREAIAGNDSEALARSAHRLKGSAGAFGNGPAFDKAAEMESLGRNGDLARARESLEVLEREMRNLAAALLSYARTIRAAAPEGPVRAGALEPPCAAMQQYGRPT